MFGIVTEKNIEYNLQHLPQIIFEVTDACNLRCKYCAYADLYDGYDKRENQKLPFHKARLILDYLHEVWRKNYAKDISNPFTVGFYGGEPLLNIPFIKQVMEYVEGLEQTGKNFHYSMTTNAMLLDKYMDLLAEKKVQLLISLDGDEEAIVRLDGLSEQEYGLLEGEVASISPVPDKENNYIVEIIFPKNMNRHYEKELSALKVIKGTVEIITHDQSLLEGLFNH